MKSLDELDKLAAIHLMGWPLKNDITGTYYKIGKDKYSDHEAWQPTRNIAQAFELLEKLGCDYTIDGFANRTTGEPTLDVDLKFRVLTNDVNLVFAGTASEAITRTCLASAGVDCE